MQRSEYPAHQDEFNENIREKYPDSFFTGTLLWLYCNKIFSDVTLSVKMIDVSCIAIAITDPKDIIIKHSDMKERRQKYLQ